MTILFTKVVTMSDMKCPICGGEMIGNIGSPICHYNQDCPIHDRSVPKEIYDLLERTRKELEQSEICCSEWEKQALDYKAKNIALSGDLECTRKALNIAIDALKDNLSHANFWQMLDASRFHCIRTKCELALDQIKQITETNDTKAI